VGKVWEARKSQQRAPTDLADEQMDTSDFDDNDFGDPPVEAEDDEEFLQFIEDSLYQEMKLEGFLRFVGFFFFFF